MKPTLKILPNKLQVMVIPLPHNPTVTVMTLVATGSKYETKNINGISHFLEHLCFKGTENRPGSLVIAEELESLGAQSNAFTSHEYTGYWAKAQVKHLPKLMDIIADLYLHPLIPSEEIEKEKGVILDEMRMYEDMPMRKVHDVLGALMFADQPAGWSVLGTSDNIQQMNREVIMKYRSQHYVAESTLIVVAGNVKTNDVVNLAKQAFRDIAVSRKAGKKKINDKQTTALFKLEEKQTDQSHIAVGIRTVPVKSADAITVEVLTALLGQGMSSRLFTRIREKMGVGYYVRAYHEAFTDHGLMTIATGVASHRTTEVITAILEECNRLIHETVTLSELNKTKEYMIGSLMMSLEASDDVAQHFGIDYMISGLVFTREQLVKKIKSVTEKDLQKMAKKLFKNDRMGIAIVGKHEGKNDFSF